LNQTRQEYKDKLLRAAAVVLIFVICIAFRWRGEMPPFDDAYHLKRITNLAILQFDPDRGEHGAFTPWPPLYDLFASLFSGVQYLPPVFFSLFAACLGVRRRQPPL